MNVLSEAQKIMNFTRTDRSLNFVVFFLKNFTNLYGGIKEIY